MGPEGIYEGTIPEKHGKRLALAQPVLPPSIRGRSSFGDNFVTELSRFCRGWSDYAN